MSEPQNRYGITKDVTFEAAHRLPNHPGKCKRLHGHSYRVVVLVTGERLYDTGTSRDGMLIDTAELAAILQGVIGERLDHNFLNEVEGLENPTTEIVVRWIYERVVDAIKRQAPAGGPFEVKLELHEGFTSKAVYPA